MVRSGKEPETKAEKTTAGKEKAKHGTTGMPRESRT